MKEIIIGIVSGVITGFGMGGGTVLIMLVSLFFPISHHVAQSTNLVFFVPTAIASIIINSKQKCIDYKMRFNNRWIWNYRKYSRSKDFSCY